jgi:hypothetical protein
LQPNYYVVRDADGQQLASATNLIFVFLNDFNAGCGAAPGLQRNKTSSAWLHDEGDDVVSYTADDEDW